MILAFHYKTKLNVKLCTIESIFYQLESCAENWKVWQAGKFKGVRIAEKGSKTFSLIFIPLKFVAKLLQLIKVCSALRLSQPPQADGSRIKDIIRNTIGTAVRSSSPLHDSIFWLVSVHSSFSWNWWRCWLLHYDPY